MKKLIIDTSAIRANLNAVKERAGKATIIADLSGDAFGLGLCETARLLRDGGVRFFAVSDPQDAAKLRRAGFVDERIMMLRSTADSDELGELIDLDVICTVGSYDAAVVLNGIAEDRKTVCEIQIKIDTGLGRYGFMPNELDKITAIYKYMPNLAVAGVFTSFSDSARNRTLTLSQLDSFQQVIDKLGSLGLETGIAHACDSAALFRYEFGHMDAVRIGTAFSGRIASKHNAIQKVGYIEASIEEVGWFPSGHIVGKKVLKKARRLAVLSVGYYNGFGVERYDVGGSIINFLLKRKRKIYVRIGQSRVPVESLGMLYAVIDVTDVECSIGTRVMIDVDPVNVKGIERVYISVK